MTQASSSNVPHAGGLLRNFVGDAFTETEKTFANINPVDGSTINHVCEADSATVDAAVSAARQALAGPWEKMSGNNRSTLMHKVAECIEARFDDFVAAEMADTGKSLWQEQNIDIPRGAANIRIFADLAKNRAGKCFQTEAADGSRTLNFYSEPTNICIKL